VTNLILIPNYVSEQIDEDLAKLRESLPEDERPIFDSEIDHHRNAILCHIHEYGTYPDIGGIERNEEAAKAKGE